MTDFKTFQKAPAAPINTNFDGGTRAKKNAILAFFETFDCGIENLVKIGSLD